MHARGRRESRRGWRRWTAASCEWPVVVRVAPARVAKISDWQPWIFFWQFGKECTETREDLRHWGDPGGARRLDNFIFFQVAKNGA